MGSGGDINKYAHAYLEVRMWQLYKDMTICLEGRRADDGIGFDHAYFPALTICCGTLELLANLYGGSTERGSPRYERLYAYRKFLPDQCYSTDKLRVLFGSLRNALAHHSTAGGLWIDRKTHSRRITWKICANTGRPGLAINVEAGVLRNNSPYDCRHTHRLTVRLGRLWRDIRDSVIRSNGYRDALLSDPLLMQNFEKCLAKIYPK